MSDPDSNPPDTQALPPLPQVPAITLAGRGATWLDTDGVIEDLSARDAAVRALEQRPLTCCMPVIARRLNISPFRSFDLLELFAFVRPAQFCLPTPAGLAAALDLDDPGTPPDPSVLYDAAFVLLQELGHFHRDEAIRIASIAENMQRAGWLWGPWVCRALGVAGSASRFKGLDVWDGLEEWADPAPPPPPGTAPVAPHEAVGRLTELLGPDSEERPGQRDYTALAAEAFSPRDVVGEPKLVLAEAGTGTGKTLGYIAPASVWAARNQGTVWVSTYTKNLQRQLDQELSRAWPDPAEKAEKAVIRKGRENYLCLLNFQEQVMGGVPRAQDMTALGLMARWISATRDGDMMGGDFPAWLTILFGPARTTAMTDRRGECVFSACEHYRRCFVENTRRKSARAEIVVANHALVLIRAAQLATSEDPAAQRYVFDEGHHLFDAADSTFSAHLTGQETEELRRWIRGGEQGRRTRIRGLEKRVADLVSGDDEGIAALQGVIENARVLAGGGWQERLGNGTQKGATEKFLAVAYQQVQARASNPDSPYGLECDLDPPLEALTDGAAHLAQGLKDLKAPMIELRKCLLKSLQEEADELDTATRLRIDAAVNGLSHRIDNVLNAWISMLDRLRKGAMDGVVDWLAIDRIGGRDHDIGMHRHFIDPSKPFAEVVLAPAHGALITSASLRDRAPEGDGDDWTAAEERTGLKHILSPARRLSVSSPFDYANRTKILVVTDVRRDRVDDISAAYRALFMASGGGAIGLFTAIRRLRAVHERLLEPLENAGIPLYAQHIDPIDTPTLIDIFRAERDSCLLGTDAVRDGVDVPGQALRLIVFDRVPWPRPDILHKARQQVFGKSRYNDMLTRLKLKQAYGRLLRRAEDKGVFVMLDSMLPSRLADAFPPDVEIERVGLRDAVSITGDYLTRGA